MKAIAIADAAKGDAEGKAFAMADAADGANGDGQGFIQPDAA